MERNKSTCSYRVLEKRSLAIACGTEESKKSTYDDLII